MILNSKDATYKSYNIQVAHNKSYDRNITLYTIHNI